MFGCKLTLHSSGFNMVSCRLYMKTTSSFHQQLLFLSSLVAMAAAAEGLGFRVQEYVHPLILNPTNYL